MTLEEKYPNVYKALELWSADNKANYKKRFDNGELVSVEYIAIMNKICVSTREEVEYWLNTD